MNLVEKRAARPMLFRYTTPTQFCLRIPSRFCLRIPTRFCSRTTTQFRLGQCGRGCTCVSYVYVQVYGLHSLEVEHFPRFYPTSPCGGPSQTTSLSQFALEETEEAVTRWNPYLNPCFEADDGVSFSCHVDWVDVLRRVEKKIGWSA